MASLSVWKTPRVQNLMFAAASMLLFWLTGGIRSPLTFILYLPILFAALRGAERLALLLGVADAVLYAVWLNYALAGIRHPDITIPELSGILLSFPVVAVFAGVLGRSLQKRVQTLSQRTGELSDLLDMSQMLDSAVDLTMTLDLLLLHIRNLTGCPVCGVYLRAPEGSDLELRAFSGSHGRPALSATLDLSEAQCGHWALDDPAIYLNERVVAFYTPDSMLGRDQCLPLHTLDSRVRSFACLPLSSVDGLLGMIYLGFDTAEGLNPALLERLEYLATRAGASLHRIVQQQGFQSLAYSDAMTRLPNFRAFERTLNEELGRAERYGRALTVILLDIDRFKHFNDTYGHPAGDALLAQVAVVLQNSLRSIDRPARYGGEEFVVVCPETGVEEAAIICERIRFNMAETHFTLPDGSQPGSVTVSIGYAAYPEAARSARALVSAADAALYAAKGAGRNTVRGNVPGLRLLSA